MILVCKKKKFIRYSVDNVDPSIVETRTSNEFNNCGVWSYRNLPILIKQLIILEITYQIPITKLC